jgi:hypothetical protein
MTLHVLTHSLRLLPTLANRLMVVMLTVGSCQLAFANVSIDRARQINHGSSRTGNRLSACRLEAPLWELGVSHGSPPRDSLEAANDATPSSRPFAPYWAALSSRPLLARQQLASTVDPAANVLAPATTAIAAVPARGPPAL